MKPSNWVLSSGVVGGANHVSTSYWCFGVVRSTYQINITGSLVGTFRLEVSNDQGYGQAGRPTGSYVPTNWNALGSSSTIACSTTSTSLIIPFQEMCYEHARITFTNGHAAANGTYEVRVKDFSL